MLSPASKILECCLLGQMDDYMNRCQLWHPGQHSYRKLRNTTSALLQLSEKWLEGIENKATVAMLLVDLSSAFDLINVRLILGKMRWYWFRQDVLALIGDYLTGRKAYVSVAGKDSEQQEVPLGCPQGSCLGPALFILFVNDMLELGMEERACCESESGGGPWGCRCWCCSPTSAYADDTSMIVTATDEDELRLNLNKALDMFEKYLEDNRMKINKAKTEVLRQGSRIGPANEDNLRINAYNEEGEQIGPKDSCKLLGLYIARNTKWDEHIKNNKESIMSKLRRRLGLLKFLCKAMQSPQRKILANGLILSIITNNIQLWGFGTKTLLKKVQVMQNKTAKWVLRLPNKSRTKKCYEVLGWMSVRQLLVYHSLMMLFK